MDLSRIVHAHTPAHAPVLAADWAAADARDPSQDLGPSERPILASRLSIPTFHERNVPASRASARSGVSAGPTLPDLFAHQLVSTHFGGSGRHFEPMKPWSDTLTALRAGVPAEEALHGRIAYNCSHLRSYFAKVAVQPEGHEPSECLNACRGQAHKHGYICRFCKEHVSSDLHQMKYGPCIRHFRRRACVLPEDELDVFLSALDCVDEHYQRSSRLSEARHAERQAGRLAAGIRARAQRSGSAQGQAGERGVQTSKSSSLGAGSPGPAAHGADGWVAPGRARTPMPAALDSPSDEVHAIQERQRSAGTRSQTLTSPGRSGRPLSDARYSPYTTLWPSRPSTTDSRFLDARALSRVSTWPQPGAWPFDSGASGQADPLPLTPGVQCKNDAHALPSPFLPIGPEMQGARSHCWQRVLHCKTTACTSYARTDLDLAFTLAPISIPMSSPGSI